MWKTLRNGQRRSIAPCKLCGLWLTAQAIAEHWQDIHREQWLKLQSHIDAASMPSEDKEKTQ